MVRRWRRFNSDLPALLDEWASSLFRELDYRHEAANGVRFRELYGHLEVRGPPCAAHVLNPPPLAARPCGRSCRPLLPPSALLPDPHPTALFPPLPPGVQDVYVPRMHTPLCTRRVLVMEWVDGERLRTAYSAAREGGGGAPAAQVGTAPAAAT